MCQTIMKESLLKKIGVTLGRSVALFATFALVTVLSRLIFGGSMIFEEEDVLSPQAMGLWNAAFLLLIFYSSVFTWNRHAAGPHRVFLDRFARGRRFGKLKSICLTPDLYLEFVGIALLSLLLPLSFLYDCVGVALLPAGYGKGTVMAVVLPALLAVEVLAHLSVRSAWVSDGLRASGPSEPSRLSRTLKSLGLLALIYGGAAVVIPWFVPVFVTLANLGAGAMIFVYIALFVLAVVLCVVAVHFIRAIGKRRDFVKRLKRYCADHAIPLSEIRRPCASLFFQQAGVDFTLEHGGTVYDCKLVAGVFARSPIVFSDTGEGFRQDSLRLFRVDLIHLNTCIDYRMDDRPESHRKLIIVLPTPKHIYVSVQGASPCPADTGERFGAYTLYTATGFLHALDRGN